MSKKLIQDSNSTWRFTQLVALCFAAGLLIAAEAFAGSRLIGGRGASGWQVFVIYSEAEIQYALIRGGSRMKYAYDIDNASNRLTTLDALAARMAELRSHQWVTIDQWERGASEEQLTEIKTKINEICKAQRLACVYSF